MQRWDRFLGAIYLLLLCTGTAGAQQAGTQARPSGATASPAVNNPNLQTTMSSPSSQTAESSPMTPVTGAEQFVPGSARAGPSYLLPALGCTEFADTDATGAPGRSSVVPLSACVGNLTLQRVGRRSQFNTTYAGGGFYFNHRINNGPNARPLRYGTFHSLSVSESVAWQRWRLLLMDQLSYLPESAFAFGGFTGLNSFGSGAGGGLLANPPALNPTLGPNQTILIGRTRYLGNVVATQLQYDAGKRSTFTASGTYGKLHFVDAGFIDSDYWDLQAGYNFSIGRRDVVGVNYLQQAFRFELRNQRVMNRGVQLAYGHRLTGRLSLFLSGGPLISRFQLPQGGSVRRTIWNTSESFQYGKSDVGIYFGHYTTAGSGVLQGAETEVAGLSFGKQLSRKVRGALGATYAHNRALTRVTQTGQRPAYQTWQGSATLSRELGRNASFYLNYQLQRQLSNTPFCLGGTCGRGLVRHVAGLGFNWHSSPIGLH